LNGPRIKVRVRDRVADQLVLRGAITPGSAVAYEPSGRFERWLFDRLRRRGEVIEAAAGRFYLHLHAYHAHQARWQRRAVPCGIGAIVIALLLTFLYV
jgi:hypothetical protein